MMDDGLAIIAGEIGDFVTDSLAPLAEGLNEVSKRVDDLHQRPLPANGKDGAAGKDGAGGAKGDTGEKGADGVGVEASVYVPGVYREGSLVQAHFGQFYKALRDTSQGVDSDDWQRVGTSGFRICGGFEADRMYKSGDLFVKDFGLFLSDGEQNRLIAGRGAQGQKGKQGPAGKDGVDGQDGADGRDGSQIEALEINNTNLVAVFKSAEGDLETHSVDLSPILDATVEITKSFNEAKSADIAEAVNEQFKGLWATVQEHLSDKQATPIRFYRGLFSSSVSYQPGDLVNFSQSLYVAKRASYGILPFNQMARDINSSDYWAQIVSGGGALPNNGGGTLPDNVVLDDIDGTIVNKLLGREIDETGKGLWRPIYSSDVIPADGAGYMTRADGSILRNQADINKFLYAETQANSGGGGADLSLYVKRPIPAGINKWMVYNDSAKQWAVATTDLIETNSAVLLRDNEGRFKSAKEIPVLKNQLEVNRFLWAEIEKLNEGPPAGRLPIYAEDEPKEYPHAGDGESTDLEAGDQWYQVVDPNFDYENPDPEGLDLYIWTASEDDAAVFEWVLFVPEEGVEYVKKKGGDSMEGPLNISTQPGTGARDSRRINTLGVYSNSENSSLQLGTTNTKIYVGSNDTSFNGPIKVSEIQDRGNGIQIEAPLKFGQQSELFNIETDSGTTQNINLFGPNSNSEFTTLKFNILGATWKNAIEFESGGSTGKETILRLDSNKGLKARNLNMDDTRITDLADPINLDDAVNLGWIQNRFDKLITENSSGAMKFMVLQYPRNNGEFTCLNSSNTTTYEPLLTNWIWAHENNLSGYPFNWDKVQPNTYFYMAGPGESLCRFRVVATPTEGPEGGYYRIRVAEAEIFPADQEWVQSDEWDVLFRQFTGGTVDLDEYVKKSGDTMTGTLGAPKVEVKDDDTGVLVVEGNQSAASNVAARITMSNAYSSNAYGKIEWHGTTGTNGWFQFSNNVDISSKGLHGVGNIRFKGGTKTIVEDTATRIEFGGRTIINKGNASTGAGFEVKGKTSEGSNSKLLQVYHNSSGEDAVNYYGKQQGNENLATVGYVKSLVGGDSGDSGDTPFTPYGPVEIIPNGGVPSAGEMSFGNSKPSETASIALHKTDTNGEVWDYQFNKDSIFTVTIVDELSGTPLRQTISLRVDGVEDKGSFVVLTTDGRDLSCKQRDESTGDYYFVPDPAAWCLNWGAIARPLQKVPVTFDEIFQFRDETSAFPTFMKFRISTGSGDGFSGAAKGRIYFEDNVSNPSSIRLCSQDTYGYGFLGRADKTTSASFISCPGEMTVFARSKWSKQLIPVEGYYFDSLYFNHSKSSMSLQNWGKSWDDGSHHTLAVDETIFVKFDFSPKAHTSARMEQQIAELTARLAKLEGGK